MATPATEMRRVVVAVLALAAVIAPGYGDPFAIVRPLSAADDNRMSQLCSRHPKLVICEGYAESAGVTPRPMADVLSADVDALRTTTTVATTKVKHCL